MPDQLSQASQIINMLDISFALQLMEKPTVLLMHAQIRNLAKTFCFENRRTKANQLTKWERTTPKFHHKWGAPTLFPCPSVELKLGQKQHALYKQRGLANYPSIGRHLHTLAAEEVDDEKHWPLQAYLNIENKLGIINYSIQRTFISNIRLLTISSSVSLLTRWTVSYTVMRHKLILKRWDAWTETLVPCCRLALTRQRGTSAPRSHGAWLDVRRVRNLEKRREAVWFTDTVDALCVDHRRCHGSISRIRIKHLRNCGRKWQVGRKST